MSAHIKEYIPRERADLSCPKCSSTFVNVAIVPWETYVCRYHPEIEMRVLIRKKMRMGNGK